MLLTAFILGGPLNFFSLNSFLQGTSAKYLPHSYSKTCKVWKMRFLKKYVLLALLLERISTKDSNSFIALNCN